MRPILRAPKYILLSAFLALPLLSLHGCGTKDSAAAATAAANGKQAGCQPSAANEALTDAVVAQCDQGSPRPAIYVPNLPQAPAPAPGRACTTDHFTQSGSGKARKLDVLFVMDTSSRMGHRWTELAEHLERFTEQLNGADLRFAVTLAHVDEQEGQLWAADGQPKVLDNQKLTMKQIRKSLYRTFWDGASKFDDRSLGEAAFYSLHKLVTTSSAEAKAQGFFRDDAGLLVLFQSDEQEIGTAAPRPLPHGIRPRCDDYYPPMIKKEFYDPAHVNVNSAFAAVRALKGSMPVSMNAFVNIDEEDMDHYLPVFQHPSDGKLCKYASPGYGYFEMVAKTGGLLRSLHEESGESLEILGRRTHEALALQHDFPLSRPAKEIDATSIKAAVDNGLTPHTYSATANLVHLDYAGKLGSKIDISYCQPQDQAGWAISAFAGVTTQTTASLSWKTTQLATTGKIVWGSSPGNLSQTAPDTAVATSHAVTISGLTPNTTYYFQAVSADNFGTEKRSAVVTLTTQPIPLPQWTLTGFSGTANQTAASLSFATAEYATVGQVFWGTSPDQLTQATAAEASPVKGHVFAVTGLTPDTTYYFQAVATDDKGQVKRSNVISISTQPIPLPGWSISAFTGASTQTTVTLTFATNEYATTGRILWGTSAGSLAQVTAPDASPTKNHRFTLSGLTPNTTYYFEAVATDDHGQAKESAVIAITTQPIPLPVWSIEGFSGTAAQSSVALAFDTSAYATLGKIVYGTSPEGLNQATAEEASAGIHHAISVDGLSPNTTYYFQASATDDRGQTKLSNVIAVTTLPIPLPVWSLDAFAGASTQTTATLTFKTSGYATTGKIVYGTSPDNLASATELDAAPVTAHSFTVSGLTPNTTYYFQAVASDDRGQTKASNVIAVTTQPIPLPVWTLTAFAGSPTQAAITLTFKTSEYATTGFVRWGTSNRALDQTTPAEAAPVTAHSITVAGLSPSTTYYFQAVAIDDRGQSKESAVIAVTTQDLPPPVWSIDNFKGTSTQTEVTLAFDTPAYPTKGKVAWGSSAGDLSQSTPVDASATSYHGFTVSGLKPDSTYYFQAVASDDRGQAKSSAVISVHTQPIPLPVWSVTGFNATAAQTSVALSFATADYATTGKIVYGTSAGNLNQSTASDAAPSTSHAYAVTGLSPSTTYYFQAVATDDRGQTKSSAVIAVTTQAAPAWSLVGFDGTTTATGASLIWQTGTVATKAVLRVGLSPANLTLQTIEVPSFATSHVQTVSGLSPATTYYFQVTATDSAGISQTSGVISKTTKGARP